MSGLFSSVSRWLLSSRIKFKESLCSILSAPAGGVTFKIGSPEFLNRTPVCFPGMNPADHRADPPLIPPPVERTTKAGRLSVSTPRP